MRKITFYLHEEPNEKKITKNVLGRIVPYLPKYGIDRWITKDGSHLMVLRREKVKNETYDLWWE